MTKLELLVEKMSPFWALLQSTVSAHPEIRSKLDSLSDLFAEIEGGRISVPCEGRYRRPFLLDVFDYYAQGTPLLNADAEFQSALEDWPSKPWYPRT